MSSTSAPVSAVSRSEASALVRQVNRLLNRQLSSVCQLNGVKSTGIKAELQTRISNLISEALAADDPVQFQQIRQSVQNVVVSVHSPAQVSPSQVGYTQSHTLPPPHLPVVNAFGCGYPHASISNGHRPHSLASYSTAMSPSLTFKSSPFYHVESVITEVRTCEAMASHRNSIKIPLRLTDHPALQRCGSERSYRVMVFCAGESAGVQDIAFPTNSELRVNGGEIKANLRGLKNKPGSTRPVDITSALRLKTSYTNNIEFTYALTNKVRGVHKFFVVLNVCNVTSVEELVARISSGRRIPKDSVIRELNKKAQDPDVVATSQVLSLKCPLSYMRLSLPCRGLSCTHIQCFDATSYLQLQEQGPQWLCPICSKSAPYEQLAVDEYVRDILAETSRDLENVTIEPNGRWLVKSAHEQRSSQANGGSHDDDDDDDDDYDEIEISEVTSIQSRRFETPKRPLSSTATPMSSGKDSSSLGPRGSASVSSKRPASAIIDLTLSSDDEDELPPRPAKRQNTSSIGFHSNIDPLAPTSFSYPAS